MLPRGFEVIGPHNFALYTQWMVKAKADETVRRFLSNVGWFKDMAAPPDSDWEKLTLVSDRSLVQLSFIRDASLEISTALWTLGENKKIASGRALFAMLWAIKQYRYFRRVRSGCKTCNDVIAKFDRSTIQ